MRGIGGNTQATIQVYTDTSNAIGEHVKTWADAMTITGWIDMQSGQSSYGTYNAKIQESTHVFVADYITLASTISAESSRMVINGKRYDILLIDNPMELGIGSQLEFLLKFTGEQ